MIPRPSYRGKKAIGRLAKSQVKGRIEFRHPAGLAHAFSRFILSSTRSNTPEAKQKRF